jgi:uncharacterized repeat protein (TIGR01451 family)
MRDFTKRILILFVMVIMIAMPVLSFAWPADEDWVALLDSGGVPLGDPESDSHGDSRELVGDASDPAAYIYADDDYMYYRLRVDADPAMGDGLRPFGWGFIIDTNNDSDNFEWLVMVDGIGGTDDIYIGQNTIQSTIGHPGDLVESINWTESLNNDPDSGNFRVTEADTNFNGDPLDPLDDLDYFLDFRISKTVFYATTGLNEDSVIRLFIGSSDNAQKLTADLTADWLWDGLGTPVTPSGQQPSTGTVKFVEALDGSGDMTVMYPGDTIYIRVDDDDQNKQASAAETLDVEVTTTAGDIVTVTLTETGADTGIFTASLTTAFGAYNTLNTTLEVDPVEQVIVEYIDAIDADQDLGESRTDSMTAQAVSDLALTKSVDDPTPDNGDTIVYTITVTNNGPADAVSIEIEDVLPASGLTYDSHTATDGTYTFASGMWSIDFLADAATATLDITVTVTAVAGTVINNTASIDSAGQVDPDSSNDTASASVAVGGTDLSVTKTGDKGTPATGEYLTYTITVTNNDVDNAATNVVVNDAIPTGTSYDSDTPSGSTTYDDVSGDWTAGTLAANGGSASLTLVVLVTGGVGSTITNTAFVSTVDQPDPDTSNDTASYVAIVQGVDLEVTKVVDDSAPGVGDTVTYTITIDNNGTNDGNNIELTDVLPAGLTWTSDSPSQGTYSTGSGVWSVGTVLDTGFATLDISATVDVGYGGESISNTASITAVDEGDPDTTNNSDEVSLLVQSADLEVTKTVSDGVPNEEDTITYTVTITNNGPDTATNIELIDIIDSDLSHSSSSADIGTASYSGGTKTVTWTIASLANGVTATLTINATVDNNTAGETIENTAQLTASDPEDPEDTNDWDRVNIYVEGTDVSVTKTVSNSTPDELELITYTITVTNNGPNDANTIKVTDALPAGVSHDSDDGSYNTSSGVWSVGDLIVGATATLNIVVEVDTGTAGDTIDNSASFTSMSESDIDFTNNLSTATIYVEPADVALTKTISDTTPNIGDTVTYTITATNNGPSQATNIMIEDILPSQLTYSSNTPSQGVYTVGTGEWGVGTLNDAASATLTINATVNSDTDGQVITNTVEVVSLDQLDGNGANDTASVAATVQRANLIVSKSVDDSTPDEGTQVTYTITVINNGPSNATNVTIEDILPAELSWVSDSPSQGSYSTGSGIWTVGTVLKRTAGDLNEQTLQITMDVPIGTGDTPITNTACIDSLDQDDPLDAKDCGSVAITPVAIPFPDILVVKFVSTFSDPVNDETNPKSIPGAYKDYTITTSNQGDGTPDADSVVVNDTIPANLSMCVADPCAGGSGAAIFIDGATTSSLALGAIEYDDGDDSYSYVPSADADGFDSSVVKFRVNTTGTFGASSGAPHPSFSIRFRTRID